jgi:hypothetical protein
MGLDHITSQSNDISSALLVYLHHRSLAHDRIHTSYINRVHLSSILRINC